MDVPRIKTLPDTTNCGSAEGGFGRVYLDHDLNANLTRSRKSRLTAPQQGTGDERC